MKKSNLLAVSLWALAGLSFAVASGAGAKNDKVDVCHLTGSANKPGFIISVTEKSAAAHAAHGDPETFVDLGGGLCEAGSGGEQPA